MLVFATSDKGGTGRSVTSINVAYRGALAGKDVAYLDFDFGSPTAGAIFSIPRTERGTRDPRGGLHSYFAGTISEPIRLDIWESTDRSTVRQRSAAAGRLVLLPGDEGGGEFPCEQSQVELCSRLLLKLNNDFDLVIVDLSAGRSYATQMVLAALGDPRLAKIDYRWLVFHRWTRQHIIAAAGLAYGGHGIVETGVGAGLSKVALLDAVSFVRTAVLHPEAEELSGLSAPQITWLRTCNQELQELAKLHEVGRTVTVGEIPLEPVLQWREQIISDSELLRRIANPRTVAAFTDLAKSLIKQASAAR